VIGGKRDLDRYRRFVQCFGCDEVYYVRTIVESDMYGYCTLGMKEILVTRYKVVENERPRSSSTGFMVAVWMHCLGNDVFSTQYPVATQVLTGTTRLSPPLGIGYRPSI
jgi:hypothetical protein